MGDLLTFGLTPGENFLFGTIAGIAVTLLTLASYKCHWSKPICQFLATTSVIGWILFLGFAIETSARISSVGGVIGTLLALIIWSLNEWSRRGIENEAGPPIPN